MALPSLASFLASSGAGHARIAQPVGDLLVAIQLGQVLRRRDRGHQHRLFQRRFADGEELHLRRFLGQLLEIRGDLGIVGQFSVRTDLEAEELFGRGLRLKQAGGEQD